MEPIRLQQRCTAGASVRMAGPERLRLEIPPGPAGRYRLAQIDDYAGLRRENYPWEPPAALSLRARAAAAAVPGTWGFGFWNAPMSFSFGLGGTSPFPAIPNAAWFFHASGSSCITFTDDLPGNGFLTQVFRTRDYRIIDLIRLAVVLPLVVVPPAARRIRAFAGRKLIRESGGSAGAPDVTEFHDYRLEWTADAVSFRIDGRLVHQSPLTPREPLTLVIWIDNQYAAFTPQGRLRYGLHRCPEPQWLEIEGPAVNGKPLLIGPDGADPGG